MRYKNIITLSLCMLLSFSLISCSSQKPQETPASTSEEPETQEEPLLDSDATDEDLLELLGDDVHVVMENEYAQTLKDINENTNEYAGQIYQLEGIFTKDGDNPYLSGMSDEGSLPLAYMTQEPADGSRVRITGIVNQGEVNAENVAVLEVLVVENLEKSEEAELQEQE